MFTITQDSVLAKLPVAELQANLRTFLAPLPERLPDARLPAVAELMVHGIIASQSPVTPHLRWGQVSRRLRVGLAMTTPASGRRANGLIGFWKTSASPIGCCSRGYMGWRKRQWSSKHRPTW